MTYPPPAPWQPTPAPAPPPGPPHPGGPWSGWQQPGGPPPGYPQYPPPTPYPAAAPAPFLAPPERRLGARAVDIAAWFAFGIPLELTLGAITGSDTGPHGTASIIGYTGMALFVLCYWLLPVALTGATPGKRLFGIRVTTHHGRPAGFWRVILREITFLALWGVPILGLINSASCLWDKPRQQCLHDKIAGTAVIRRH